MLDTEAESFMDFTSDQTNASQCSIYESTCNEPAWDDADCEGDLPDSCDDPGGGQGGTQN